MPTILNLIQNGGLQQYEDNVTLKKKLSHSLYTTEVHLLNLIHNGKCQRNEDNVILKEKNFPD